MPIPNLGLKEDTNIIDVVVQQWHDDVNVNAPQNPKEGEVHMIRKVDWMYDRGGEMMSVDFGGEKPSLGVIFITLAQFVSPVD